MTQEQVDKLLQPRVKCIGIGENHYPNSPFSVGDILLFEFTNSGDIVHKWFEHDGENKISFTECIRYKHLFSVLHWFQQRPVNGMPEYVKLIKDPKYIFKVLEFTQDDYCYYRGSQDSRCGNFTSRFLPATLTEYEQYCQSKEK